MSALLAAVTGVAPLPAVPPPTATTLPLEGAFVKRTKKRGPQPLTPMKFVRKFNRDLRPYGKDASGQLVTYTNGAWVADDDWLHQVIFRGLADHWSVERRNRYIAALKDSAEVIPAGDPALLNLTNGLLDWSTSALHSHDPDLCGRIQLGTHWDPAATCPRWLEFLRASVPPDALDYVQELVGYMLYLGNPFQFAFLLHGAAGSGKSTFLRILQKLIGRSNTSARSLQELGDDKFATADLFGKQANICGDIDPTRVTSTSVFKRLVGEDPITAQRKFGHAFDFMPEAKLIFSANELPQSADLTGGWFRRWLMVPFPFGGKKRVAGFEDGLAEELPGILVWAVAGLQRLMTRGGFNPPPSVLESAEEYRRTIDSVAGWLAEQETYTSGDPHTGDRLYWDYVAHCDVVGLKPLSRGRFYARVEENGIPAVTWSGTQKFYRVRSAVASAF